MVSTKLRMTLEQASAMRVILKFEFVGRTGELLTAKDSLTALVLAHVVRNAELWNKLDAAFAWPMQQAYKEQESTLTLDTVLSVALPTGAVEILQEILKDGIYKKTLETANSNKEMQTSMGAMIPLAIVEKNIEGLLSLFEMDEQSPMVFFPMKAVEGKQ